MNHMDGEITENATASEGCSSIAPILNETALVDSMRNTVTPWGRILKYLSVFIVLLIVSLLSYALGSRTKPAVQHELPNSPRMVFSFSLDSPPSINPQTLNCVYIEGDEKDMRIECSAR
ncbi:hypothetical protein SESI111939_16790 [Serratia silvae]